MKQGILFSLMILKGLLTTVPTSITPYFCHRQATSISITCLTIEELPPFVPMAQGHFEHLL